MKTLKENYQKNVNIMIVNLKRGLTKNQADKITDNFRTQLLDNNLYEEDEANFIQELKRVILEHFTMIKINIVK